MAHNLLHRFIQAKLTLIALGAVIATVIFLGARPSPKAPVYPPPPVIVARPRITELADTYEFTGETRAFEQSEVRARVEGFLQEISYQDGATVKAGDVLFVIDPAEHRTLRDELKAEYLSTQADLKRAELDLERIREAVKSAAVSQQELSHSLADRDKAAAKADAMKAKLAKAELELGYTRVVSPIDGVVGRHLVDRGTLLGLNESTLLATVTRMNPMYVIFNVSENVLVKSLRSLRFEPNHPFTVFLGSDPSSIHEGQIDYVDSGINSSMGTILIRGVVDNAGKDLLPGMFVRVRVPAGKAKRRLLVSQRGFRNDLGGAYLLLVGKDNIVEKRYVTPGMEVKNMRQVNEKAPDASGLVTGIDPSEKYIVEGVLRARPGSPVAPRSAGELKGESTVKAVP